jgi:hypothetical protein
MQVSRNEDAQGANLLGWFKQVGHHHRHHASGRRRTNADVRVFENGLSPPAVVSVYGHFAGTRGEAP